MNKKAKILALLFVGLQAALLAGCGSEDGPVLSDEEKIKQASAGREAQMKGQTGPPANGGQTGP